MVNGSESCYVMLGYEFDTDSFLPRSASAQFVERVWSLPLLEKHYRGKESSLESGQNFLLVVKGKCKLYFSLDLSHDRCSPIHEPYKLY